MPNEAIKPDTSAIDLVGLHLLPPAEYLSQLLRERNVQISSRWGTGLMKRRYTGFILYRPCLPTWLILKSQTSHSVPWTILSPAAGTELLPPAPVPGEAPALSFRNAGKQTFWGGLVLVRTGGVVMAQRDLPSQLWYGFTPSYSVCVATVGKMWVLVEPGSVLMQGLLYLESMVCNSYLFIRKQARREEKA